MYITYILIKKTGDVVSKKIRDKDMNEQELYKRAGFRSPNSFELRHTFHIEGCDYKIYAKTVGRANTENKYELPPPIDKELYYGTILIFKMNNGTYENLHISEWLSVYEQLFDGFEDLEHEEEKSVDTVDEYDKTKEGYCKDSFVVSDIESELEEEDYISE